MSNSTEVKSLKALELAKNKVLQVNTNMATMVQLELKCTAHCTVHTVPLRDARVGVRASRVAVGDARG
jgi:hypothetical protein